MLYTYDPKLFIISFAGILLNEGTADGTFLNIVTQEQAFTSVAGADGGVARTRNHNRIAVATVTLMQTSDVNRRLGLIYNDDRNAVNGRGVGPFRVEDLGGSMVGLAPRSFISNDPDVTLADTVQNRAWEITLSDWNPTHAGSPSQ